MIIEKLGAIGPNVARHYYFNVIIEDHGYVPSSSVKAEINVPFSC